jgi:hypothetical protein
VHAFVPAVLLRVAGRDPFEPISPLLGSRTGLSTAENPMAHVAAKLAELVAV